MEESALIMPMDVPSRCPSKLEGAYWGVAFMGGSAIDRSMVESSRGGIVNRRSNYSYRNAVGQTPPPLNMLILTWTTPFFVQVFFSPFGILILNKKKFVGPP